ARMAAGWEGLRAAGLSALDGTIAGVVRFGDRTAAIFQGAYDAAVAIWGSLPGAIGDLAFQAANGLISGVEAMLNGVATRINGFIETLNTALALLPEWATGEGGVRIGRLDPVELGRIGNPFEGAATAAGSAAADAFSAALARSYLEPPDLGLGAMAEDAGARSDAYREAAGMLAGAADRPLASWQALKDAVAGTGAEAESALSDAAGATDALTTGLNETASAAKGAGAAAKEAGVAGKAAAEEAKPATEATATGWKAVTEALSDYAKKAKDIGADIGQALVSAFQSAENAVGEFVKTGKLDCRDLVTSLLADLSKLAARRFLLGPIANALSGALGGAGGVAGGNAPLGPFLSPLLANILHAGGTVGAGSPSRMVPALTFAGAPRMHAGGMVGLRHDEVPAILQRGERVLSRREVQDYGQGVIVNIHARDAESFQQSRTQIAADIARAVSLGRRGL
ncbi:MAG: phage tail tape measure C-terminal domain-containing protein, partial [Paracoccus sp. (in: a-proteobacteria)]